MAGFISSAIDYTQPLPTYTGLGDARFVKVNPTNSIENASTFSFTIPPTDRCIDMQESYLRIKLKVTKAAGGDLVADDNVCLADNVIGSLFSSVNLSLNKKRITDSNVYQPVENYFVTRFGVSKAAVKIHLENLQGLSSETAGNKDSAAAAGRVKRKAWTALSKEALFIGPVPCDFFRSCSKWIPPLQEVVLEFKLNDPDFVLVAPAGAFTFKLTKAQLITRQVEIDASIATDIRRLKAVDGLKMNFTSMEVQSFSLPANARVEFIRGIFPHKRPTQIFMILIETDRLNGVMTKDPFKFEHGTVEKVILKQNGGVCMIDEIETDFTADSGCALDSYKLVTEALNVGFNGQDCNLTYDQFKKGATMWAWTLSPDMDANNGVALLQTTTNFDAEIYVKPGINNSALTALFLGKFGQTVTIREGDKTTVV
jgi:hypothetical protein